MATTYARSELSGIAVVQILYSVQPPNGPSTLKEETETHLDQAEQHLMCDAARLIFLPTFPSYRHQGKLQPVIGPVKSQQFVQPSSCVEGRLWQQDALNRIDDLRGCDDSEGRTE